MAGNNIIQKYKNIKYRLIQNSVEHKEKFLITNY